MSDTVTYVGLQLEVEAWRVKIKK